MKGISWRRMVLLVAVLALAVLAVQTAFAYNGDTEVIVISPKAAGTTEDGIDYDPWDILGRETYDTCVASPLCVNDYGYEWYKLFDGEEYGLGPKHKINAISIVSDTPIDTACGLECADAVLMSFIQSRIAVPDIADKVNGQDVVAFVPQAIPYAAEAIPGSFELFFDGSDVGLTTLAEKIDGLDYFSAMVTGSEAIFPDDCNAGILFISTQGAYRVPAANGGSLVGKGSDVLMFCATNLGPDTTGYWFTGHDGDARGVRPYNAMSGLDIAFFEPAFPGAQADVDGEDALLFFYFTTRQSFTAPFIAGGPNEVFVFPYNCAGDEYGGPLADLNEEHPSLNGTAMGFDLPHNTYVASASPDC